MASPLKLSKASMFAGIGSFLFFLIWMILAHIDRPVFPSEIPPINDSIMMVVAIVSIFAIPLLALAAIVLGILAVFNNKTLNDRSDRELFLFQVALGLLSGALMIWGSLYFFLVASRE
jgi:hypothetical protein